MPYFLCQNRSILLMLELRLQIGRTLQEILEGILVLEGECKQKVVVVESDDFGKVVGDVFVVVFEKSSSSGCR